MSVIDCITSFVDGRVRLRHPALKEKATADLICSVVGAVDGITAVQANPVTGSLLIYYDVEKLSREQLLELAEQGAAFLPEMNEASAPAAASESEEGENEGGARKSCSAKLASAAGPVLAPVDEILHFLTRRSTTRFVNRAMLVSLIASLAALPMGRSAVHSAAGGVFVGGLLQHLLAHRKAL